MTAKPRYPERSHARHTRTPKPDPTLTGQRPSAEKASADHPPHPHPRTYDQTRPPAYSRGQITPPWLEPDQLDIATRWRGVLLRASSDSRSPGVPIHPGDHNRCADPQRLLDPVGGALTGPVRARGQALGNHAPRGRVRASPGHRPRRPRSTMGDLYDRIRQSSVASPRRTVYGVDGDGSQRVDRSPRRIRTQVSGNRRPAHGGAPACVV